MIVGNRVADIGITGPDKGKGGKYLLLPPGYKGDVPEGYFVARSETFGNWVFFRTFLKDGDPKPGVDIVKKYLRVYPLAEAANPPEMKLFDFSGNAWNTIPPTDFSSYEFLNRVIQDEPNGALNPDMLGLFASIGIEKGKPFAPDARMKKFSPKRRRWGTRPLAPSPIRAGSRTPFTTRTVRGAFLGSAAISLSRTVSASSTLARSTISTASGSRRECPRR